MFLIIGEFVKEHYLEKIKPVDSFGLLADKTSDVSVLEQLMMFVKFVDYELGEPRMFFFLLNILQIQVDQMQKCQQKVFLEFDFNINKMKSVVSDEMSVMTGIRLWCSSKAETSEIRDAEFSLYLPQVGSCLLRFWK